MKEKIVIFDIDDVHPSEGYGLNIKNSPLKYIKKLNQTFGLKATLFIPLNWHNKYPLWENKEWVKEILRFSSHGHEISAHGLYHEIPGHANEAREFLRYDEASTEKVLNDIKKIWNSFGINIEGIRFPGWGETIYTEKLSHKYFKYIASHIIGEKLIKGFGGIYKLPYNLSIENLYDVNHDVYILHSHIGPEGTNKNNLNFETYKKITDFLIELNKKNKIRYMTMGEYIKWLNQ